MNTHLSAEALENFHRPRARVAARQGYRIAAVTKERHHHHASKQKKRLARVVEVMKHKSDLSAREGRVILTEYLVRIQWMHHCKHMSLYARAH